MAVLIAGAAALFAVSYAAYRIGRDGEDSRQFLIPHSISEDELWISMTMDYARHSAESNDILVHGDSTARIDIDGRQLGDLMRLKAFNAGTAAPIGWSGFALVLKEYLEHHPKPRVVVFCVYPAMLAERYSYGYFYQERFNWSYGSGGEEARPSHADPLKHYIAEGLQTVFGRIRSKLVRRGKMGLSSGKEADWLVGEWKARKGSLQLEGHKSPQPEPEPLNGVEITPGVLGHLREMAALCRASGTLFAIRPMPVQRGLGGLTENAIELLKDLDKEFGNTVICRPEIWEMDRNSFFDDLHLNAEGAAVATAQLAAELGRIMKERGIDPGKR